jgi:hypothetical protein
MVEYSFQEITEQPYGEELIFLLVQQHLVVIQFLQQQEVG